MRILVVDDHPVNRTLVNVFLSDAGCDVVEAGSGFEALDLIEGSIFDAVLLDVSMPGMSGEVVCDRIRANPVTRGLRLVAYTAHALEQERATLLARGFDDILTKPISRVSLLAALQFVSPSTNG